MMNSDNVQAGTVTRETLKNTGWRELDQVPEQLSNDWHESLGAADGLTNTANEFPSQWDHEELWTDDQDRVRQVGAHSHATSTLLTNMTWLL